MLSYNEITQRKQIQIDEIPYEVISSHVFRKQKQKPLNQTKLKNLITGKVIEKSFHHSDTVDEAILETESLVYLYKKRSRQSGKWEFWFNKEKDPQERFSLAENTVGERINYVKENTIVDALTFNESIIGIKVPIKVTLEVTEAPPGIKGNTAQGGTKPVTLETGIVVSTPMFINEGDTIVINTETGEYVERAYTS